MAQSESMPALLSFRRQNLLVEFSSLRSAPLDGVFVSITPGDPLLWVGVIFVRKGRWSSPSPDIAELHCSHSAGPYAPAVLRFQISFPATYPTLPPLVTFSTDVFHPLLTPLTTYTYTTGSSDTDTVSATDEERLPPGGFSLRHGFPQWFGRARRTAATSRNASGSGIQSPARSSTPKHADAGNDGIHSAELNTTTAAATTEISIIRVLDYIRSTFSDEAALDSVPLEAAANPGAYHAWRAYRAPFLKSEPDSLTSNSPSSDSAPRATARLSDSTALGRNRRPGDWNWEGVWEERVRKAVRASLSEPVLFGGATAVEDIIRFRDGDQETMENMRMQLEVATSKMPGA